MPSFLNDLRRLSKASFRSENSSDKSSSGKSAQNALEPSNQSSSTISTAQGSSTPPSTIPSQRSSSNLSSMTTPNSNINGNGNGNGVAGKAPPVPQRPVLQSSQSNRYSIAGASTLTLNGPPNPSRTPTPNSPYAPRVLSISDNSWVHQKVFLIYGQIAEPAQQSFDGTLWVCHHQDSFPATAWPVCDSHFKALVHLQPGPNRIRFDFVCQKLAVPAGNAAHSSYININYLPLVSSPPLDLVILLGKDSPGEFDAVPERKQREGNGLQTAIRKFKMMAYLWQAFTGEQMNRNNFGRRCFRYEEEWQPGTISDRDAETGQMRNEVKIHIVRTEKSVKELRDADRAQQNPTGSKTGELFSIASEAVKNYFQPQPGQTRYVSVLILDTHWDTKMKLVRGHAALGGGDGTIQLAIFGSHSLQSYPSCIEEVLPAFTDCTRTNTDFVANDCNESGSNWEAANIGIGAHLHETGHLFGCPHQESGVMLRDYVRLNRTFTCREPFSTRTKSPGQRLCLPTDECAWHRLDCLRFRFHPCFQLPSDPTPNVDDSIQVWSVDNGGIMATSTNGIAWIELFPQGNDVCRSYIEYIDINNGRGGQSPKTVMLSEADLRSRLAPDKQKSKLKLELFSAGHGQKHVIEDLGALCSKSSKVKMSNGQMAFRGSKLGYSQMEGSRPQEVLLWNVTDQRKLMTSVRVYAGFALDGVEFFYEDQTSQLFGKRGGKAGGNEFGLDTRRGEVVTGFYLRAGLWIDGLQVLTSLGRKSEIFGNPTGGSGHTLIPPRGYSIAGISGSCGQWVDGFQVIITR